MTFQTIVFYGIIFFCLILAIYYILAFFSPRARQAKKGYEPSITFVIPAYNAAGFIENTVNSIKNLDYPKEKIKVIIVNDGSTDNTLQILKRISKNSKNITVLSKKNEGKAVALNYGLKRVYTDISIVLDADTLPRRDLVRKIVAEFSDSKIMAAICRIMPLKKRNFLERMQYVEYVFTGFFRDILKTKSALQTTPAFSAFRTEIFREVGYFDPGNLTEDLDMGLKIQQRHYDIGFVLDSYAETSVPSTFRALTRQRVRWNYGMLYNLRKYRRMFSLKYGDLGIFLLPSILLSMLAMLAIAGFTVYNFIDSAIDLIRLWQFGFRPDFFDINLFALAISATDVKIVMTIALFMLSFFMFWLIQKTVRERIRLFDWLLYLLIYMWLMVYFYIASIIAFLIKKPEW